MSICRFLTESQSVFLADLLIIQCLLSFESLDPGFLSLNTVNLLGRTVLGHGGCPVLCVTDCIAAYLATAHKTPVATVPPPPIVSANVPWHRGGEITPDETQ